MVSAVSTSLTALRSALRYLTGLKCFEEARLSPYGVSLPKVLHRTLSEEGDLRKRRVLVVGDVHGCCDELEELIEKTNGRSNEVCVVFVGDLVNKGPKNAEVIKLARSLSAFCVRGNHDEVCMKEWEKSIREHTPLPQTFKWMEDLSKEEMQWFFDLPYSLSLPSRQALVVHAGLVPGVPLEKQKIENLVTMRNVYWDKESNGWQGVTSMHEGEPWVNQWEGPEHVYFGHDARRQLQLTHFATGLDTGCVYGGELTAVFAHSGERTAVPAKTVHKNPNKS